jgi:hypothetical protein
MSNVHQKAKPADGRPVSLDEFFDFSRKRAPGFLGYAVIGEIDRRPLRPGEMMRITALIRGDNYREQDMDSVEARCAAALVAARVGLDEVLPVLRDALSREIPEPLVKCSLAYAHECLSGMAARGTVPDKDLQLIHLLRMRDSVIPIERRFADIVLEKADVKYGTITSW